MSDPVSDVEIEDVLSSIRRLVGDEHRAKPSAKPQTAPQADAADPPTKPARLVLTPSLLVAVPDTEPEPELAPASEMQAQTSEAPFGLESYSAADEFEAEAEPEYDAEPEAVSDFVFESIQAHGRATAENEPEQAAWANPETTLFDASGLDDDTDKMPFDKMQIEDDEPPIAEALESQESTPAFDVAAQAAPSEDALEQADPDQTDPEDPFAVGSDDAENDATDFEPDFDPDTDPDIDPDDNRDDDTPYSTATLGAKIAALEAKIGQTQDQWEPDGELGDDYAGTRVETIKWQDHEAEDKTEAQTKAQTTTSPLSEPEPTPKISEDMADQTDSATEVTEVTEVTETAAQTTPEPLNPEPESDETIDLLAADDAILDEESLRELVADIVRQELQGALGERITRNVRKLVRREIHRALTAQELD